MATGLPLVGQELAGYRLRAVLGRGGMSVVFQAENPRLSNLVALKVLAPELASNDMFRARFLQESRIAAGLSHPNVIPIYDMGSQEDLLYIAMRHVAGADLRAVLQAHGRLSPQQALSLIRQAARALDAAHRHDLVHRDVKPANLLIEPGIEDDPDHVYLADFGLSKHELSRSGLTATGQFVGTLAYVSPEQIQGKQVDGRADIYSLGCVLYESLTGRVPFVKEAEAAIIWAHVEEQPMAPSVVCADLPEAFDEVISRALAKRPEDRYASCRELIDAAEAGFKPTIRRASRSPGTSPETVLSRPERPIATVDSGDIDRERDPQRPPPIPASEELARVAAPAAGQGDSTEPDAIAFPPFSAAQEQHRDDGKASKPGRCRYRWPASIAALLGAAAVVVAALVLSAGKSAAGKAEGAALAAVPRNRVTGSGTVTLTLRDDVATVTVATHGLLDGRPHLMHIHAGGKGICPPAAAARRHNGHLAISTGNGIAYYGQTLTTLSQYGSTSGVFPNNVQFEPAPNRGSIDYKRTIVLTKQAARLIRLRKAVIVVHGIDYNGNHVYDPVLGVSDLDKVYTGESTAPALCGPLRPQGATAVAHAGSGAQIYTAALGPDRSSSIQQIADGLALFCHLGQAVPQLAARRPWPTPSATSSA